MDEQDIDKLVNQALTAQDIRKALISLVAQSYCGGYHDGLVMARELLADN